ncbi:MAG TPA: CsgG/HfaB family protein [Gemmatimonadaceae bacterium]|nr:CsgG/HfaB family protein [Gemmatimonadaceae bacterium]
MRHLLVLTAIAVVALPAPPSGGAALARKTVAGLAFDNNPGNTEYDHLGQGMATMMTSDLAAVDEIQLVERQRLDDVTREIERQRTSYFDSTTAVKVGRLSGAEYIVTGAFVSVEPNIRIDTRVVRVETGAIVKTAKVTGKEEDFFDLQKRLARQLVKDLDVALTPAGEAKLDERQEANRVNDLGAVLGMSNAIAQSRTGDYGGAVVTMAPVVAKYPKSVVVRATYDEIKRQSANSGKQKAKEGINKLIRRRWP